jgi:hypothetical protein
LRPTSPNKVLLSAVQVIRPGGELVPRPFSTRSDQLDPPAVRKVVERLQAFGRHSTCFRMTLNQARELLDAVFSLIEIDDGWEWDFEALKEAVGYLASNHRNRARRDRVIGLYTMRNTIRKWNDPPFQRDPQRAPYSSTTEAALRLEAGDSPALGFYHNIGRADAGWKNSPFVWPVLFVPNNAVPTVFANNRRRARRRRR